MLIGVYLLSMVTIAFADLPPPPTREAQRGGRPLALIVRQPLFLVALACQMLGYGTMNLVMTSTPLALQSQGVQIDGSGLAATAFVIQWHVVAMFLPSFFTGHLIARLGIVGGARGRASCWVSPASPSTSSARRSRTSSPRSPSSG